MQNFERNEVFDSLQFKIKLFFDPKVNFNVPPTPSTRRILETIKNFYIRAICWVHQSFESAFDQSI